MIFINRRRFLVKSGLAFALTQTAWDEANASRELRSGRPPSSTKRVSPLYNENLQTAIGLGDEPPGVLDKFGQLKTRNAEIKLELGSTPQPLKGGEGSQSLVGGFPPIVETQVRLAKESIRWVAFTSDKGDVKADYVEIKEANGTHVITLWFPFTTLIKVSQGTVTSGDQVLAMFPPPQKVTVSQARYNCLTPKARPWEGPPKPFPGLDPAFGGGRVGNLDWPIEYRFPVAAGKTYHVFLGFLASGSFSPGAMLVKLSVNGQAQVVDVRLAGLDKPILREFIVTPESDEIRIKSEVDPSSTGPFKPALLNGIWIFDGPVNPEQVKAGKLNQNAVFYVPCGKEPARDVASSVVLEYGPEEGTSQSKWIRLPYSLGVADLKMAAAISPESAQAAAKERWVTLLQKGAEFTSGVRHLDDLYKTSLINIFLLRTKYSGAANGGQDLYVVKPGATVYDAFWYRDGAYLVTALDVAGHSEEAEKSLRLFWQSNLAGAFALRGQQTDGSWQFPPTEWDGQGQALWALGHHFLVTGDKDWLRSVYTSIRKGALWIKNATEQTQILHANGERPIYFGLLPLGYGEAIGGGRDLYCYYHDFWAVLGLRKAIIAAEALQEKGDSAWMKKTYDEFCANLLASVKLAYQRVGSNQFIPADPSDPHLDIWGSIAALFPSRFLEPHDPMISSTLDRMARHAQEDEYTYFVIKKIFTYITADWAMCYLLRNELPMFYRLFNGYVEHASPTNAWIEEIFLDSPLGTGDMPHGWAAAMYVHLHRNCFVYEDGKKLELCWGVQPDWLKDGATLSAKEAPTEFGKVRFELQRLGSSLVFDYNLTRASDQASAEEVRLHIPQCREGISSIRVNGTMRSMSPGESIIRLA